MKKLVEKSFKDILNMNVRMINLPDDDIDMGIFVVHDKKTLKMSEKELSKYEFDFALTRTGKEWNSWVYLITQKIEAVFRNNELVSPPDSIVHESVMTYVTAEQALRGLILEITKNTYDEILAEHKMGILDE